MLKGKHVEMPSRKHDNFAGAREGVHTTGIAISEGVNNN